MGIPRRVSFSLLPGTVVSHSVLCHSFLADGPTDPLRAFYGRFAFHVSSIITIILSKAERWKTHSTSTHSDLSRIQSLCLSTCIVCCCGSSNLSPNISSPLGSEWRSHYIQVPTYEHDIPSTYWVPAIYTSASLHRRLESVSRAASARFIVPFIFLCLATNPTVWQG